MNPAQRIKDTLTGNSLVTIGSAASVIVVVVTLAWKASGWQSEVGYKLNDVQKEIGVVQEQIEKRVINGWHKNDMRTWTREFSASNGSLTVPEPKNSFD